MATTGAALQKAKLGRYVALLAVTVVLISLTILPVMSYRFQAQVFSPDYSGYHIGPTKAFYDYTGGGYQDESGYGLQIDRLDVTCMKVIASREPQRSQ